MQLRQVRPPEASRLPTIKEKDMAYPGPGGTLAAYNITAATVIKAAPGWIFKVIIITPPTVAGGIYNSSVTTGLGSSNLIDPIGTTVLAGDEINLDGWPCDSGITVNPGTGGVVTVS